MAIYADDTSLYFMCDQESDLWQQLELASELESDLRDTADRGRKWLVEIYMLENLNWFCLSGLGAIDVKMDGFVLEKSSFAGVAFLF